MKKLLFIILTLLILTTNVYCSAIYKTDIMLLPTVSIENDRIVTKKSNDKIIVKSKVIELLKKYII